MISPNGYANHCPFGTMGSGSLAAGGILETKYKDGMTEKEAMDLAIEAIEAGIFYDLGSGSNVDLCLITKTSPGKVFRHTREYHVKAKLATNENTFPKGTTQVLETTEKRWTMEVTEVEEKMDIC